MWSPQWTISPGVATGITWGVITSPLGLLVGHDGGDRGYNSGLSIFPEQDMGVIMLVNGDYSEGLFELPGSLAWLVKDSAIIKMNPDPDYLERLAGTYVTADESGQRRKLTISQRDGALYGADRNYRFALDYLGGERFINPDGGVALVFDSVDEKNISLLIEGYGDLRLKKTK